jgi:hypothetical protein
MDGGGGVSPISAPLEDYNQPIAYRVPLGSLISLPTIFTSYREHALDAFHIRYFLYRFFAFQVDFTPCPYRIPLMLYEGTDL